MRLKVAVKLILFCKGKVLIVADPDGNWDFPGGGIENDEKLEEALNREITEELGLKGVEVGRVLHIDEWFIPKKELHVVGIFYRAELKEAPMFVLSEEHSETAWIDPKDIDKYNATDDTVRALEVVRGGE